MALAEDISPDVRSLMSGHRRQIEWHMSRLENIRDLGFPPDAHNREFLIELRDRITALLGEGQ